MNSKEKSIQFKYASSKVARTASSDKISSIKLIFLTLLLKKIGFFDKMELCVVKLLYDFS
jgi:hypothetical protein